MDFRPKLYKIVTCLLVSIFIGNVYSLWNSQFVETSYFALFMISFLISFIILYIVISLFEKRW